MANGWRSSPPARATTRIWIADRRGNDARQVTGSRTYKSLPRWSADSRQLVFASRTAGQTGIVVLDVAAGTTRTIRVETTPASAPSWSHDGRHVYFGSPRGGSWQLWRVAVEGGEPSQVTTDGGYAALESLDGRWLYYTRLDRPGLLRRPAAGGADELVAGDVRAEDWPNWGVLDRGVFYLTRPDDGDPQLGCSVRTRPSLACSRGCRSSPGTASPSRATARASSTRATTGATPTLGA